MGSFPETSIDAKQKGAIAGSDFLRTEQFNIQASKDKLPPLLK